MEPSSLPQDSVRFFYIDPLWVHAFLDGAMSLGNHIESDKKDTVKAALELALTRFLETGNKESNAKPQVPISGCLIRSSLVEDQPDLAITAPRRDGDLRSPIVKRINLAPDVLMILFDRELTSVEFPHGIEISLFPHQQSFVVSNGKVTADTIDMVYRNPGSAVCGTDGSQTIQEQPISRFITPDGVILSKNFAQNVHDFWNSSWDKQSADAPPSSALLAHHLASRSAKALHLSFPDAGKQESNLLTTLSLYSEDQELTEDVSSLLRVEPAGFATETSNEPRCLPSEDAYTLQVYTLAYPSSKELSVEGDSRLPHDAERPLDLVFRLQLKATDSCAVSSWPDKVSIHIPSLSSSSPSTNGSQTFLLREHDGPGPKMVNNTRYIAAMNRTPGELVVTLVPRMKEAAETGLGTKKGRDLSFLLPKVRINAIPETLDVVFPITVREYSADLGKEGSVVTTARVRLFDIGHLRSIV